MKCAAFIGAAFILFSAAVLARTSSEISTRPHGTRESTAPASAGAAQSETFDIEVFDTDFRVSPPAFAVNLGDSVTLHVSGAGHSFLLSHYMPAALPLSTDPITISFVAGKAGTFVFDCSDPFAADDGMPLLFGWFEVVGPDTKPLTITSFDPVTGGSQGEDGVTIIGTGFMKDASVYFGSVAARDSALLSDTRLVAISPPHSPGNVPITVKLLSGRSTTSTQEYGYAISPSIDSVVPSSGSSSGGTRVTITGSNFKEGATVYFGRAATDVIVMSSTSLMATTPPAWPTLLPNTPEPTRVTVINPDNIAGSQYPAFSYVLAPVSIGSLSPVGGAPEGGTPVVISGAGFTAAVPIQVLFGSVPATHVVVADPNTLLVTAPPHLAGLVDVVVMLHGATASAGNAFTYSTVPKRKRAVR